MKVSTLTKKQLFVFAGFKMKNLLFALAATVAFSASAQTVSRGYRAILFCSATEVTPRIVVWTKGQDYFLSVAGIGKLIALETTDGDMGYMSYAPVNPKELGKLSKYISSVYVYNNEEDIEDVYQAVVTWGEITYRNRKSVIDCRVIDRPRRY